MQVCLSALAYYNNGCPYLTHLERLMGPWHWYYSYYFVIIGTLLYSYCSYFVNWFIFQSIYLSSCGRLHSSFAVSTRGTAAHALGKEIQWFMNLHRKEWRLCLLSNIVHKLPLSMMETFQCNAGSLLAFCQKLLVLLETIMKTLYRSNYFTWKVKMMAYLTIWWHLNLINVRIHLKSISKTLLSK